MDVHYHRDGSMSIRLEKDEIEPLWNIIREGRGAVTRYLDTREGAETLTRKVNHVGLGVMHAVDHKNVCNAYRLGHSPTI